MPLARKVETATLARVSKVKKSHAVGPSRVKTRIDPGSGTHPSFRASRIFALSGSLLLTVPLAAIAPNVPPLHPPWTVSLSKSCTRLTHTCRGVCPQMVSLPRLMPCIPHPLLMKSPRPLHVTLCLATGATWCLASALNLACRVPCHDQ